MMGFCIKEKKGVRHVSQRNQQGQNIVEFVIYVSRNLIIIAYGLNNVQARIIINTFSYIFFQMRYGQVMEQLLECMYLIELSKRNDCGISNFSKFLSFKTNFKVSMVTGIKSSMRLIKWFSNSYYNVMKNLFLQ